MIAFYKSMIYNDITMESGEPTMARITQKDTGVSLIRYSSQYNQEVIKHKEIQGQNATVTQWGCETVLAVAICHIDKAQKRAAI